MIDKSCFDMLDWDKGQLKAWKREYREALENHDLLKAEDCREMVFVLYHDVRKDMKRIMWNG